MNYQGLFFYLLSINLFTFAAFWADKYYARKGKWRVPEATLLMLALMGGSPAAFLAQQKLRHKTSKTGFRRRFYVVIFLQMVAIGYFALIP